MDLKIFVAEIKEKIKVRSKFAEKSRTQFQDMEINADFYDIKFILSNL